MILLLHLFTLAFISFVLNIIDMRKLIFLSIILFIVSCSSHEKESNVNYNSSVENRGEELFKYSKKGNEIISVI